MPSPAPPFTDADLPTPAPEFPTFKGFWDKDETSPIVADVDGVFDGFNELRITRLLEVDDGGGDARDLNEEESLFFKLFESDFPTETSAVVVAIAL